MPGILKVAGQEYEDLTCRHIDIMVAQDMADQAAVDRLLVEFNRTGPVVAIRGRIAGRMDLRRSTCLNRRHPPA